MSSASTTKNPYGDFLFRLNVLQYFFQILTLFTNKGEFHSKSETPRIKDTESELLTLQLLLRKLETLVIL